MATYELPPQPESGTAWTVDPKTGQPQEWRRDRRRDGRPDDAWSTVAASLASVHRSALDVLRAGESARQAAAWYASRADLAAVTLSLSRSAVELFECMARVGR